MESPGHVVVDRDPERQGSERLERALDSAVPAERRHQKRTLVERVHPGIAPGLVGWLFEQGSANSLLELGPRAVEWPADPVDRLGRRHAARVVQLEFDLDLKRYPVWKIRHRSIEVPDDRTPSGPRHGDTRLQGDRSRHQRGRWIVNFTRRGAEALPASSLAVRVAR
jgi:hypothetical protein